MEDQPRELSDEQSKKLQSMLREEFNLSNVEEDASEDLLEYALAMVANGKSASYIADEFSAVCNDADLPKRISSKVELFLCEDYNVDNAVSDAGMASTDNETAMPTEDSPLDTTVKDTNNDSNTTKKIISLKSNNANNALALSGALGSSRKPGGATPVQGNALTLHGALGTSRNGEKKNDGNKSTKAKMTKDNSRDLKGKRGARGNSTNNDGPKKGRSIVAEAFKQLSKKGENDRWKRNRGEREREMRGGGGGGRGRGRDSMRGRNSGRGGRGDQHSSQRNGGFRDEIRDRHHRNFGDQHHHQTQRVSGQKRGIDHDRHVAGEMMNHGGRNNGQGRGRGNVYQGGRGRGRRNWNSNDASSNERPEKMNRTDDSSNDYIGNNKDGPSNEWPKNHPGTSGNDASYQQPFHYHANRGGRGGRFGRGMGRGQMSWSRTGSQTDNEQADASTNNTVQNGATNDSTPNESTVSAAEVSPSPLVAASFGFGGRGSYPSRGFGRGYRGRGYGRGRGAAAAVFASKTWTRSKETEASNTTDVAADGN